MIARSFRPLGWVAAVGAAALGCYMLSLRVAAERADLDRLDGRIVAAAQQIRSLQTELGTRGRMQQLEAWNDEVLALSAPGSGQFVERGATLARFDVRQPAIAPQAEIRLASAVAAPAAPAPQRAVAAPAPIPPAPPAIRRASLTVPAATPGRPAVAQAAPKPAAPAPARTRTATAEPPRPRQASLLDARTMRDLSSTSRAERGGGTGN